MTNAAVIPLPERSPDAIVGGNVKYLMGDRNVGQGALAERLGVDQSTLSLKLNGKRKWTVSELILVSDAFGVSIDALARRRDLEPTQVGRMGLEPMTDRSRSDASGSDTPLFETPEPDASAPDASGVTEPLRVGASGPSGAGTGMGAPRSTSAAADSPDSDIPTQSGEPVDPAPEIDTESDTESEPR